MIYQFKSLYTDVIAANKIYKIMNIDNFINLLKKKIFQHEIENETFKKSLQYLIN